MSFTKKTVFIKQKTRIFLIYLGCLLLFFTSCNDSNKDVNEFDPSKDVIVNDVIPTTATINIPIVINGSNFGNDKSKIKVFFDDVQANIITATNNHLYVINPKQDDGEHTISVEVNNKRGSLEEKKFTYNVTSSVSTVAGDDEGDATIKDGAIIDALFKKPFSLSCDNKGNILVNDNNYYLRLISLKDNKVVTIMKENQIYGSCFNSDYSSFFIAKESTDILGFTIDPNSNWYKNSILNINEIKYGAAAVVVDSRNDRFYIGTNRDIVKENHETNAQVKIGTIPKEYAGSSSCDFSAAYNPKDDYIYLSSYRSHIIFRIKSTLTQFEDSDFEIYAGDLNDPYLQNGDRLDACFNMPRGLAFDSKGNLFIADSGNHVIRKITPSGIVSTYVGVWGGGYKNGSFEEARFAKPSGIAIDNNDIIYVSEIDNRTIRCISVQ